MINSHTNDEYLDDPKYWRDRAEEIRILAEDMRDSESKKEMLRIAMHYERLAVLALERLGPGNSIA